MSSLALWQRLSLVFATLLLVCMGTAAWLQVGQTLRFGQRVEQWLIQPLAGHVVEELRRSDAHSQVATLQAVAERLKPTNPGLELYLLDATGRIESRHPQTVALQRSAVDLEPLRQILSGKPGPILGDDPLNRSGRKVFGVAMLPTPLTGNELAPAYVYALLQGSMSDAATALTAPNGPLQDALLSSGVIASLGLLAGVAILRQLTLPIVRLTQDVLALEEAKAPHYALDAPRTLRPAHALRNEAVVLRSAFKQLTLSHEWHWQRLNRQDEQRRAWIANISHDLRTPLASLQGYLETVLLQAPGLKEAERMQYLRTALAQSQRLSRMAQELLDLAKMELGTVKPHLEIFSLVELAQDVMQKLALSALSRQQVLAPNFHSGILEVKADIGMTERVLTNLIDNAIRHTPPGGEIEVRVHPIGDRVRVEVADRGPGIPLALRTELFTHALQRAPGREVGGLGLAIVRQILQLHGSDIEMVDGPGGGAIFAFTLQNAQ